MTVPCLRFEEIAPGRSFHAALVPIRGAGRPAGRRHRHDFHEVALIRSGRAEHHVGPNVDTLAAGDAVLVRPADEHVFVATDDSGFDLVNVAFPSHRWRAFCALGEIDPTSWDGPGPPRRLAALGPLAGEAFDRILRRSTIEQRALDLVDFLVEVFRAATETADDTNTCPDWLSVACAALDDERGLAAGVDAIAGRAPVSRGHLTRTMVRHRGVTPVAFVNRRRLEHATVLLATTDEAIGQVAQRCGYASQSYFDRRFVERFEMSPREYRRRMRQVVAPAGMPG